MELPRLYSASQSILSPSTYLWKSLEPFLHSENVRVVSDFSDDETLCGSRLLLSIEDTKDLCTEAIREFADRFDAVCAYFHDTTFLETKASVISGLSSCIENVLFPWEGNYPELRSTFQNNCCYYYFPYPWVPLEACDHEIIDREALEESQVVLTMRGVREGRLHVILDVLEDLDLLNRTIILTEDSRKAEFQRALWSLKIDSVKCYSPTNVCSLKGLLKNALCLINPSFSSVRPLSPILMEAFHEKVPVLLSDFGSSRVLPDCIERFELGSNERGSLKSYLKIRMDAFSIRREENIQEILFSYAEEYGNPQSLGNELLKIVTLDS